MHTDPQCGLTFFFFFGREPRGKTNAQPRADDGLSISRALPVRPGSEGSQVPFLNQ